MTEQDGSPGVTQRPPLAPDCSLCGQGYHPHLEIEIGEGLTERDGEMVYGWAHVQCIRDHDRAFLEAFGDD